MSAVALIALYGAILSTLVAFRTFWIDRDRIRVVLGHGLRNDVPGGEAVVVVIRNHGRRPIFVRHAGLVFQYERPGLVGKVRHAVKYRSLRRKTVGWIHVLVPGWLEEPTFPLTIEPGASEMLWLPATAIDDHKGQVFVAQVQDGLHRNTYSNRLQA